MLYRDSGTDKTDKLTCEIIHDNFTCENYRFSTNHVAAYLKLMKMDVLFYFV